MLITAVIFFAEAMGTTTITLKEWKTENYRITHYSSIAWAGQPSEYIYLKEYKAGGLLNTTVGYLYQNDIPKESDCKIGLQITYSINAQIPSLRKNDQSRQTLYAEMHRAFRN